MKERGILFSADMVRAILDDRKTQTRRVMGLDYVNAGPDNFVPMTPQEWVAPTATRPALGGSPKNHALFKRVYAGRALGGVALPCPYGQPGDRLWVRETWYDDMYLDNPTKTTQHVYYRADGECCDQIAECCCKEVGPVRWRPSIFMPRWASRITLEITAIRAERVQQITPADATAEAATEIILDPKHPLRTAAYRRGQTIRGERYAGIIQGYAALWDSLNAKRGYGWDTNPWVWVIEFNRIEQQRAAA